MQRRKQKTIIFGVVGAVGLILISIFLLLYVKEHSFTRYVNKSEGYSIKYPSTWTMEKNSQGASVVFFTALESELDFFKENVNVVIQDISGNPMNIAQYSKLAMDQMAGVFGSNFEIVEKESTYLDDRPAFKIIFLGKGPEFTIKYKVIMAVEDVFAYQITYTSLTSTYDKYVDKVDKIIESFTIK